MKKAILITILFTILFYVYGTVAAAGFNIFKWSESVRQVISGCWISVCVFASTTCIIDEEMKKNQ